MVEPFLKVAKPVGAAVTVLAATEQVAHASTSKPEAQDTAIKMEQTFERAEAGAGALITAATLIPGRPGQIAAAAQISADVARVGIHATGGDERIVAAGKSTERFAKAHGWTDVNAETAGAVAAAATSVAEGTRVLSEISMGPVGWAILGYRAWKKK